MDMARKSRKAKESRVGGKNYVTPAKAKAKVTKRKGTTTTYKPKPSPQLKPKPAPKRKAVKLPNSVTPKTTPKKKSLTSAKKLANDQRRKNLRSEVEGRFKGDKLGNPLGMTSLLAKIYGKDIKNMTHLDEAELAGKAALDLGIGVATGGAFKAAGGAKKIGGAVVKGVKATGRGAVTGAKATGRAVATGAKATRRGARIARVAAKKADRKLLKAQGLSRQGGKVRKVKKPNPFGKNAANAKPKPKVKSDKKNPFAGPNKTKTKPKTKVKSDKKTARKRRKAGEQDDHVRAY